mmetsp:Transcript_14622/g.33581  ORF Transcript_14622/g.33581 Transcript_14622/m.33581 type:complete len:146 (+) Transcript_14622:82-519(+)
MNHKNQSSSVTEINQPTKRRHSFQTNLLNFPRRIISMASSTLIFPGSNIDALPAIGGMRMSSSAIRSCVSFLFFSNGIGRAILLCLVGAAGIFFSSYCTSFLGDAGGVQGASPAASYELVSLGEFLFCSLSTLKGGVACNISKGM